MDRLGLDLKLGFSLDIRSTDSEVDDVLFEVIKSRIEENMISDNSFIFDPELTFSGSSVEDRSAYMTSG